MALSVKEGVDLRLLVPQMAVAIVVVDQVCSELGVGCVITSGRDSKHSDESFHYLGAGLDFRTRELDQQTAKVLEHRVSQRLGSQWDVVFEGDHLHVEFDPPRV